jgi:hypothetical protein
MANIFPEGELEIADTAGAKVLLVPDGPTGEYELWTRQVSFGAAAPAFSLKGVFGSLSTVPSGALPLGGLFQARLFRKDQGPAGALLGTLDFPVLGREARADYLTACAETPQVDITVGGTFASISFATNVKTMARVQLATSPPGQDGLLPVFKPTDVVATATSLEPKVLHRVSLQDLLTDRETTDHSPMLPRATLFFTILAWTNDGKWDYVWSAAGAAPGQSPAKITLKDRRVGVRLSSLYCNDDSDSSTFGEADFLLIVRDSNGVDVSAPYRWSPMASGSLSPLIPPGTVDVILMPPRASGRVTVRITAKEDDSGTPFDDDDTASAGGATGAALFFPAGEGKEEALGLVRNFTSNPGDGDDILAFAAQIVYSVRYL